MRIPVQEQDTTCVMSFNAPNQSWIASRAAVRANLGASRANLELKYSASGFRLSL